MTGKWPSTISDETCPALVDEPPGYWHRHRCDKPTKHEIVTMEGGTVKVCGIHKRVHDRRTLNRYDFDGGGAS